MTNGTMTTTFTFDTTGNNSSVNEGGVLTTICTKYYQTNQARAGVQRYKPYGSLEFHDSTLPTWQWVGNCG